MATGGQRTCVFPVSGQKDAYIAMFDLWRPEDAIDGCCVWLPVALMTGTSKSNGATIGIFHF